MSLLDPSADRFHLRPGLLQSDARFQPPPREKPGMNNAVGPSPVIGAAHYGKPGVRVLWRRHFRRHHADHRGGLILKRDRFPDHRRIALKYAPPKPVTDHHQERSANF